MQERVDFVLRFYFLVLLQDTLSYSLSCPVPAEKPLAVCIVLLVVRC